MGVVLTNLGDNCFRIQSGETSLLLNPSSNRLKADVILRTLVSPANSSSEQSEVDFPGEYEVKGITIQGWPIPGESSEKFLKTVYLVGWEDLKIVFLGHISGHPPAELTEELAQPDLLFIPTGDHYLSPEEAAKIIKQLEPAVVVPAFESKPDQFLKAVGQKPDLEEKFVFRKKDLADKKSQVILLEDKG